MTELRIDLHTHSTASDGTDSPGEVVRAAAAAGLDVVALTDHDTTAGWAQALAALPAGLQFVPGTELSCKWAGAPDRPIGLHLLAYLFDPEHPELKAALEAVRSSRLTRAERMVMKLREAGLDISWEEVQALAAGGTVGRPHIGMLLIQRGLVSDMQAAFASEWLSGARFRVAKEDIDVFEALRLVRAAGGVAVFAHPRAASRGRTVPDSFIAELAAAGLGGLEADHEDHEPAARAAVRVLGEELGLVVTGSSDYHGANKRVRIGQNASTTVEAYERLLALAASPASGR